jgi:DNA-binding response OmpR family regulator
MHITIVTQNDECSLILDKFLSIRGYSISIFASNDEAQTHIDKSLCNLLILDLRQNESKEFLHTLKKDKKKLPVIVLSESDSAARIDEAIDLGVRDYIVTPFGLSMMVERIEGILQTQEKK